MFWCSETRLHEESSLTRRCGGVGIIINSLLLVNSVSIDSVRILAVQLNVSNSTTLSIVGVYFSTTDSPLDVYKEYLQELENVVHALQYSGPVLIVGDFNAHIDLTHSNCAQCQTNSQGHLTEMIDHTGNYAGPTYTYFGGGGRNTTVDFCFFDCWAAYLVTKCETQQHHPLTLSDHLAHKVKLICKPQLMAHHNNNWRLNWRKAFSDRDIDNFQKME